MQPLDAFMSRLLPWVVGCPTPLALQALRDSAELFCRETDVLRHTTDPLLTVAGISVYDIDPPLGHEVLRVRGAWLDGRALAVLPDAAGGINNTDAETPQPQGNPHCASVVARGQIKLYPTPFSGGKPLVLRLSLTPGLAATQLHNDLYYRWSEGVIAGARMRLCGVPAQAFTDPRVEAQSSLTFWREVNRARVESRRGQSTAPVRAAARPFA